jgi:hypothetical protein
MNDINAAVREREAHGPRDANKVIMIKAAEAEAASKQLQGEGIANERRHRGRHQGLVGCCRQRASIPARPWRRSR